VCQNVFNVQLGEVINKRTADPPAAGNRLARLRYAERASAAALRSR
jgi:hypothetical protein